MTQKRDLLSRLWIIFVSGIALLYVWLTLRRIADMADTGRGIRLALVGLAAGVGVVQLLIEGLAWLYRRRTRVWLALKPNPVTVVVVAFAAAYALVDSARTSLGPAYFLGALFWTHQTWRRFMREFDEGLDSLAGEPPDVRPDGEG